MSTEHKTLFREKADTYQSGQYRTKKVGLRTSLLALGVRVLGLIVSVVVYLVAREAFGLVWYVGPLVIGICALGTVTTLGWTVVNFVRSAKVTTCPRCGSEHRIYKSVRKYMCTECRALLLLGKDADMLPRLSPCPYCGLETAVSDDHGRFICPNCGVIRVDGVMGGEAAPRACPACHQIVPEGAIYCNDCGSILKSDFLSPAYDDPALKYDEDWKIGKDPAGHLHFVRARLKSVRQGMVTDADVAKVQGLLVTLEDAFISLEEALQELELRPAVEALLPEIDSTYAALLELELRSVQALGSKKRRPNGALHTLFAEPHITARRRIEGILGIVNGAVVPGGGIGRWGAKLVAVDWTEKRCWVKGYGKLRTEVSRFRTWRDSVLDTQADQRSNAVGLASSEPFASPLGAVA